MVQLSLKIDKKSRDHITKTLANLPKNIRRNAMASALNAGARVVRDKARAKSPIPCLTQTIKTVRRKKSQKAMKVSVVAGQDRNVRRVDTSQVPREGLTKREKRVLDGLMCPPAFWVEFGTYQNRDRAENPYSPETFKRHPVYKTLGHTDSVYWQSKHSDKWIPEQPFLRPALQEAHASGAVEKAMAKKYEEYFKKLEMKK